MSINAIIVVKILRNLSLEIKRSVVLNVILKMSKRSFLFSARRAQKNPLQVHRAAHPATKPPAAHADRKAVPGFLIILLRLSERIFS